MVQQPPGLAHEVRSRVRLVSERHAEQEQPRGRKRSLCVTSHSEMPVPTNQASIF
jgi:hypothetical protein